MCTLSIFKTGNGYKVFMNRDERHDRLAERPPQALCDARGVYGPLDPVSNGTWIAHNDRNFWGCILNGYLEEERGSLSSAQSRGKILLDVLSQDDPLEYARNFEVTNYSSFRLVVGSSKEHALYVWDGVQYAKDDFHACYEDHAFFLTSSSWRQDEVIKTRKHLFEGWVQDNDLNKMGVPDFHYSQEPDLESAPMMHRPYSRTQSITALNIFNMGVEMSYERIMPHADALVQDTR